MHHLEHPADTTLIGAGIGPVAAGVRVKQLVLLIGAVYFGCVALTNTVNVAAQVTGAHVTVLNSGNIAYVAAVTKVYGWLGWFPAVAAVGAVLAEGTGAWLFVTALRRYRGGPGERVVWTALAWNTAVWLGFIVGTEFFLAYPAEAPFRDLLAISLLMSIAFAVVPDTAGAPPPPDTPVEARRLGADAVAAGPVRSAGQP